MFRIRRIYDDVVPANKLAIAEVQQILSQQFSELDSHEIESLPEKLRNPFLKRFRSILYVAEKGRRRVVDFALVMHDPELHFCYLDFLATAPKIHGRGVGASLYERVRSEAVSVNANGVFFECLPDDPDRCQDPRIRKQNAARLKFYECYGARPIIETEYEAPVSSTDTDNLPHLVFDDLDRGGPLKRSYARKVVRAILERKYGHLCSPKYVDRVVASFRTDPVLLRPPRYTQVAVQHSVATAAGPERIMVTVNDKHDIHHIRERGYVESPVRIDVIRKELDSSELIETVPVREYPMRHIRAVHDRDFVDYLQRACAATSEKKSLYPYVFPIRNVARHPKELWVRAGYYCIDTFTPINRSAFPAAKRAVDCALTCADQILAGHRIAYALVRPPGHHAERRVFGGFCYFNSTAIAAHYLSQYGKVAILDIDYHHGNGEQDIFYRRNDVLTVSIHGHPSFAYPYFSGFEEEVGEDDGTGFNLNIPLPEVQTGEQYAKALARAIKAIASFNPDFLVVALGLDPAKGDPTGTWLLKADDFHRNGQRIGELHRSTLIVQEGGYRTRTLGINARHFLTGLVLGARDR